MKSWSYNQITKHTEEQIKRILKQSEDYSPDRQEIWAAWAYGVYISWNRLTVGWQNDGDAARLETLTKPPKY